MLTCKMMPVFLVDWQMFEEPPPCKYRCHGECLNPERHKQNDPCPLEPKENVLKGKRELDCFFPVAYK